MADLPDYYELVDSEGWKNPYEHLGVSN